VGRETGKVFDRLGIATIGEVRERSLQELKSRFGKMGEQIWSLARGIDDRPVVPDREAKSISNETTFARDIDDLEVLESWLMELTEQVARRLRRSGLRARTVQLKVRYEDFDTITRSTSTTDSISSTQELWNLARTMLRTRLPARPLCVRLLGMGVANLDHSGQHQGGLFEEGRQGLDEVTDKIRERFGSDAVKRGNAPDR
jgi:DNA polymerase-4